MHIKMIAISRVHFIFKLITLKNVIMLGLLVHYMCNYLFFYDRYTQSAITIIVYLCLSN